jgi:hypothetical protein
MAPTVVPSITTEAPISASLNLASDTVPQITPVCAQADNERKLPNNKRKNLFTFPVSHLFPIPYYLLHLFAGKSRRDVLQEDVNRITL